MHSVAVGSRMKGASLPGLVRYTVDDRGRPGEVDLQIVSVAPCPGDLGQVRVQRRGATAT